MFPDYVNKLHEINTWIWLFSVIAPIAMYCLKIGSRSYFIAAAVWILSQFLNLRIEPYLDKIVNHENLVYWYGTWATIDVLCIFAIHFAHIIRNLKIGFTAMSVIVAYAALGLLQVGRFLELELIGSHALSEIYTLGVNTGNIAISTLLTAPIAVFLFKKSNIKQGNRNV
ncbi:hypothetical protein [Pseudoalteromonas rubra]|uniref:Uncharacterized protein n=1 Tax=Pseudoalteromonas rubra TaxID=43658 RepID=A0A0F4Q9L9_9GAMM|nr:hypothetical protein [Pseudoalteromonas rubra]KJZ04343.1 hypothetical protein TW77_23555 [Pseudoalteromonas rubra]